MYPENNDHGFPPPPPFARVPARRSGLRRSGGFAGRSRRQIPPRPDPPRRRRRESGRVGGPFPPPQDNPHPASRPRRGRPRRNPPGPPCRSPSVSKAPWLDAEALGNRDPELAAERRKTALLKREKALLEAELALADSKRRAELAPLYEERAKLDAERALRVARLAAKNAGADAEKARLDRLYALASAVAGAKMNDRSNALRELEAEGRLLKAEGDNALAADSARLAIYKATDDADRVLAKPEVAYPDDPLKDGTLTISDRRIPFNGVVTDELADFVTSRIDFYNNADAKKPIFIVIDSSPGGSVMAGYRILQAMKGSRAPVFVVVKQFAASMAAITTTMATRSFCYPDTVILHHQMSSGFQGNMTVLAENEAFVKDLFERIFGPVYRKLGYKDSKAFVADMYAHFRSGDWLAFGDEAARMKWVTDTVARIEETGVREIPSDAPAPAVPVFASGCVEKRDENGRVYYELPLPRSSGDVWVLDDPQHRFKAR